MKPIITKNITNTLDYKIYKDITVATGIAISLGVILVVYSVKKALKDKTLSEVKKTIKKNDLTFPELQYFIFADQLEQIMQNSMTKGYKVFPIFEQMQTQSDVSQLILAFGERTNYWFGVPTFKKNLAYWIKDELSNKELTDLNNIMIQKGINIHF